VSFVLAGAASFVGCTLFLDTSELTDGSSELADAGASSNDGGPLPTDAGGGTDASSDAADTTTVGLVGRWLLDESSGTTALDSAPPANNGTLVNGPTWVPKDGGASGALSFDGVDDYVVVGGSFPYATQNSPFSFSAFFDLTDFSLEAAPEIMQMRSDTSDPLHVLLSNSPSYLGISVGSASTWPTVKTGQVPTPGVWHHIVVTYNGMGTATPGNFKIVLDLNPETLSAAAPFAGQAQQSRIGGCIPSPDPNSWKGLIRDVRIYNRVLTTAEIATIYGAM
jgi:hypothetical protein